DADIRPEQLCLVVLAEADGEPPALAALKAQTATGFTIFVLRPTSPDGEETLWWLGKPWHIRDEHGRAVEPSDAVTSEVLVVLNHRDRPDPSWLATVLRPLAARTDLAFAGTWRCIDGQTEAEDLDIAPELYPFVKGERLPRIAVRTTPNTLLADVLDPSLGGLGLIGLVWDAVASAGPGVLLDRPLLDSPPEHPAPANPQHLKALIMRHGSRFAERLSWIAGMQADRAARAEARIDGAAPPPQSWPPPSSVTVETKIALADELGGKTLVRLAWKKLKTNLRQRLP
ncbi:MAG: hypothetical protein PSX37_00610, partial [bacterium]|nr:hypothetical protein [bacterium]